MTPATLTYRHPKRSLPGCGWCCYLPGEGPGPQSRTMTAALRRAGEDPRRWRHVATLRRVFPGCDIDVTREHHWWDVGVYRWHARPGERDIFRVWCRRSLYDAVRAVVAMRRRERERGR